LYGKSFPAHDTSLGGGIDNLEASLSLEELQSGTTYHYAIVATNGAGTRYGPDETFTTAPAVPPAAETLVAEEVSQDTATIAGAVDTRGVQSTYEFDLGTDSSYGARMFGDAGAVSGKQTYTLGLNALSPGTTYHYRLVAANSYGVSYGADRTFTTAGFPASVIAEPAVEPLLATPVFEPPSTAGATLPKAAVRITKKTRSKKKRKGRKAANAGHGSVRGRRG
ncbi:MAG TPA: hypothetical protein VIG42_04735, partial [Solirubrobacteraceae bacterium]|jgi:hypothetical protein